MYVVVAWAAGSRHYNHANSNSRSARNSQEACACTRNLCQTRNGKFARWTCLLTRKCTVHTCIYAQENNARGQGHLWLNATRTRVIYGYASVRAGTCDTSFMGISKQRAMKDASTRPPVVDNKQCHSWHITERKRNNHEQSQ